MNPDVKTKWIAALKSGEYKRGSGRLYLNDCDRYCCLGVLTDIYLKEKNMTYTVDEWIYSEVEEYDEDGYHRFAKKPTRDEEYPESEIIEWAEISGEMCITLATVNDRNIDDDAITFDHVIPFIEKL